MNGDGAGRSIGEDRVVMVDLGRCELDFAEKLIAAIAIDIHPLDDARRILNIRHARKMCIDCIHAALKYWFWVLSAVAFEKLCHDSEVGRFEVLKERSISLNAWHAQNDHRSFPIEGWRPRYQVPNAGIALRAIVSESIANIQVDGMIQRKASNLGVCFA